MENPADTNWQLLKIQTSPMFQVGRLLVGRLELACTALVANIKMVDRSSFSSCLALVMACAFEASTGCFSTRFNGASRVCVQGFFRVRTLWSVVPLLSRHRAKGSTAREELQLPRLHAHEVDVVILTQTRAVLVNVSPVAPPAISHRGGGCLFSRLIGKKKQGAMTVHQLDTVYSPAESTLLHSKASM